MAYMPIRCERNETLKPIGARLRLWYDLIVQEVVDTQRERAMGQPTIGERTPPGHTESIRPLHIQQPGVSVGVRELRRTSSEALLEGSGKLVIEHEGEEYLLRVTSKGKLILTK